MRGIALVLGILVGMGGSTVAGAAVLPEAVDVTLVAAQTLATRSDARPTTDLTLDAFYTIADGHRIRLIQGLTKHYEIPTIGGNEIEAADTSLSYYYRLAADLQGFSVTLRPIVTLPLSVKSREDGVVTRPMFQIQATRKFLDGALVVSYRPHVQFHWNRFTSSQGGTPLRRWSLGHALVAAMRPLSRVVLVASGTGSYHFLESIAVDSGSGQGSYEFDLSAGYEITPAVVGRFGMLQSDSFLKAGRLDVSVYDPARTRFYASLEVTL